MEKKARNFSEKKVKRDFTICGLFLIIYILSVLIIPYALNYYMSISNSIIPNDLTLYLGIYFIILIFGSLLPFFLMRRYFTIPLKTFNSNIDLKFKDLLIYFIICFVMCISFTFISNILFSYIGIRGNILSSIGFSYDLGYLYNPIYIIMVLIAAPLLEEYAFRGVLLNVLGKYGKLFAVYVSAFIFSLAHINFPEMVPAFVVGILLGKISFKYKSIRPTIIIHILINVIFYVLCIIPEAVLQYLVYGIIALLLLTIFFILTGKYQGIIIQKNNSLLKVCSLFFSRFTIIVSIILIIIDSLLFLFE